MDVGSAQTVQAHEGYLLPALIAAAKVERPILWFLHPNHLMYMLYAKHTLTDKHRMGQDPYSDAVKAVGRFNQITSMDWDPMSPEGIYLMAIEVVFTSLIYDVRRLKDEFIIEVERARFDFSETERNQQLIETSAVFLKTLWKTGKVFVTPLLMGIIGILIATMAQPFVPPKVAESTGIWLPTVVASFIFVAGSGYASIQMNNLRKARLTNTLVARISAARLRYDRERLSVSEASWKMLVEAYKQYSGMAYEDPMYYGSVFETGLREDTARREEIKEYQKSFMVVMVKMVGQACMKRIPQRFRRTKVV